MAVVTRIFDGDVTPAAYLSMETHRREGSFNLLQRVTGTNGHVGIPGQPLETPESHPRAGWRMTGKLAIPTNISRLNGRTGSARTPEHVPNPMRPSVHR
jgi:hypothetical protein